jgi:hypothetical protein
MQLSFLYWLDDWLHARFGRGGGGTSKLDTDEQKTLYALGQLRKEYQRIPG